jgi:glycosyltransferase involved in cell wall biosynthesis
LQVGFVGEKDQLSMAKVSVVIPTHNRADFLRGAVSSVLNQTYQNFEIIVVDDASTDDTAKVVAAFNDERIRFLRHDTNKGGSAARNTGILASKCDYIAFLDDDDEWLPEKLAKQMDVLLASPQDVGCVYTGCVDVDRTTGRVIGQQIPTKRGNLSKELLVKNCIGGASSVLLKRDCFKKVGLFDESLPRSQDYDMWFRIANEFLFEYIQAPLFKYYLHESRISTNLEAISAGLEILARKYKNFPVAKKPYSDAYLDLGNMHCLAGDIKKGRKALFKALRLYPIQIRGYFNLCLTLFGAENFRKVKEAKQKIFAFLSGGRSGQTGVNS